MECDSRWVPNGHNGPAQALLTRCLSDTVKKIISKNYRNNIILNINEH